MRYYHLTPGINVDGILANGLKINSGINGLSHKVLLDYHIKKHGCQPIWLSELPLIESFIRVFEPKGLDLKVLVVDNPIVIEEYAMEWISVRDIEPGSIQMFR